MPPRYDRPPRNFRERLQRAFDPATMFENARWYLGYPFYLIGLGLKAAGRTLGQWWTSRNGRALLLGMPAVVIGVAVFSFTIVTMSRANSELLTEYRRNAEARSADRQFALAQSYYRRLRVLEGTDRAETRFDLARAMYADKQVDKAAILMASLAPDNAVGFAPAHLWQAERILENRNLTGPMLQAAERHLSRVVERRDRNAHEYALRQAKFRLAMIYVSTNRKAEAIAYEQELSRLYPKQFPKLHLDLYTYYNDRKEPALAAAELERAIAGYRDQSDNDTSDPQHLLGLAQAELFDKKYEASADALKHGIMLFKPSPEQADLYWSALGQVSLLHAQALANDKKFDEAVQVLLKVADYGKDKPQFVQFIRSGLARLYLVWFDSLADEPKLWPVRIHVLELAVRADPTSEPVAQKLLTVARMKGDEAKKAEQLANGLLLDGQSAAMVHFLKGNFAFAEDNFEQAKLHWELALKAAPEMAVAANNIAWLLATMIPTDPQRALAMIDGVLVKSPDTPIFHGTRGQVLKALNRDREAVTELEIGLKAMPMNVPLHRSLADVYDRLGDAGLAKTHRDAAEQILKDAKERMAAQQRPATPPAGEPKKDEPKKP